MLLTNHTLTGIVLSEAIENPFYLAPAALASHFAMDSMPHFGTDRMVKEGRRGHHFLIVGALDFASACTITAVACLARPERAVHTIVGVISATLPDLLFIPEILFKVTVSTRVFPWHGAIQWYQKPPGAITEVLWALLMLTLILR